MSTSLRLSTKHLSRLRSFSPKNSSTKSNPDVLVVINNKKAFMNACSSSLLNCGLLITYSSNVVAKRINRTGSNSWLAKIRSKWSNYISRRYVYRCIESVHFLVKNLSNSTMFLGASSLSVNSRLRVLRTISSLYP